jgi:hypothetical protein
MGIDVSLTAITTGAIVVGANTLVSTFVNWMSVRALRSTEKEKRQEKAERNCECKTCTRFDECKKRSG